MTLKRLVERKKKATINRPFRVGIMFHLSAKLQMLDDFFNHLMAVSNFELLQMETDSLYFGQSADMFEEPIKPPFKDEFEGCKRVAGLEQVE